MLDAASSAAALIANRALPGDSALGLWGALALPLRLRCRAGTAAVTAGARVGRILAWAPTLSPPPAPLVSFTNRMLCSKTQAAIALLQAITMHMPASAQHMMSQKPPKNVDLRCALAQEPDHRLAYIRVLCTGLQAVECSNGGGEQPPIPIRMHVRFSLRTGSTCVSFLCTSAPRISLSRAPWFFTST